MRLPPIKTALFYISMVLAPLPIVNIAALLSIFTIYAGYSYFIFITIPFINAIIFHVIYIFRNHKSTLYIIIILNLTLLVQIIPFIYTFGIANLR